MKKIFTLFAVAALAAACNTTKGVAGTNWLGKKVTVSSVCPENGTCTATREFEKGLNLQGFETLYPQDVFNPETILVKYEFEKKRAENLYADDFYKEEIYMEIPLKAFKKQFKDSEMEQVKLVYGKHCYCKGEAGFYKITNGTLKINHSEAQTKVKLTFKAPVSSMIETVDFTVE